MLSSSELEFLGKIRARINAGVHRKQVHVSFEAEGVYLMGLGLIGAQPLPVDTFNDVRCLRMDSPFEQPTWTTAIQVLG